ncbi:class I adenylate-forming enzyme family protein [Paraburkholderia sediminicola]|uniref:class I adenylate-forming enzyme family protein n=1 Tax=Paraburkholderia sediminicola TaxID=458836 RepID=UPI0038B764A3
MQSDQFHEPVVCMILEKLYAVRGKALSPAQEGVSRHVVLVSKSGETWALERLLDGAARVAAGLANAGVVPGDRVALHLGNSPEFAIAYIACFQLGAIAAPLNLRFKQPELEDIMARLAPHAYIGEADRVGPMATALNNSVDVQRRFVLGEQSAVRAMTWESLVETVPQASSEAASAALSFAVDPTAPAVLLSSSGTTGMPKLIAHSQATLVEVAARLASNVIADARTFAFFAPMVHASGLFYFLAACLSGTTIVMVDAADPDGILDGIEAHRCDSFTASRTVVTQLLARQAERPRDVRSLSRCVTSGDLCPASTREAFQAAMGASLRTMWGSTEGAGSLGCSDSMKSEYRPTVGIETRLLDAHGADVKPGGTGELAIRGPNVALGYWTRETGVASFPDGWYLTGDSMRDVGDGHYTFVSRIKDLIVRASSNISPLEVEQVLLRHPDVEDAGVVGVPDHELGQRVVAFVHLAAGASADRLTHVMQFASSQLADYKVPEKLISLAELPRGPMGKMDRAALLRMV